ncbi:MAG: nucleotidyltransferase family protein [Deltaproteobacteria bacterium]
MAIEGVVLAAGCSSRTGNNKLLLPWQQSTIISACLKSMLEVCSQVVVVGGCRMDELNEHLSGLPRVRLIYNENHAEGMFSSVCKGIGEIMSDRFFLCPGDYPLIKADTYRALASRRGPTVIPTYQGRPGHPILLTSRLIPDIRRSPHSSLREYLQDKARIYMEVSDPGILRDVDTMEDYAGLGRSE